MYRRPSKRALFIRRMFVYALMFISILTIASIVLLFILGFRFDAQKGLEQGALLQFNTRPTGAWVNINGDRFGSLAPTKSSVTVGSHTIEMGREGYETWRKSINVSAGTLTWLDYGLLVPVSRPVDEVLGYPKMAAMVPSPSRRAVLIQQDKAIPSFDLVDIRDVTVRTTPITLTSQQYSQADKKGVAHTFSIVEWQSQGRYVLVNHAYGSDQEWLILDTQNPKHVVNINSTIDGKILSPRFLGNSGELFYAVIDGALRRINVNSGVVSEPIAEKVASFDLYGDTVIFIAADEASTSEYYAASITPDDPSPYVYAQSPTLTGFAIATTRYFSNHYVAVASDDEVTIYKGRYPQSSTDTSAMTVYGTMKLASPIQAFSFSPDGNYLVAQTGKRITTYELERKSTTPFDITSNSKTIQRLKWLNNAYLVAEIDGQLTIREFDGSNYHAINPAAKGFNATLSINGRFMYSIGQTADGDYVLQRVKMILD